MTRHDGGAAGLQSRGPAQRAIAATAKQQDRGQVTAPTTPDVTSIPAARWRRTQRRALDHLDRVGLCACWTAGPDRRCISRGRA